MTIDRVCKVYFKTSCLKLVAMGDTVMTRDGKIFIQLLCAVTEYDLAAAPRSNSLFDSLVLFSCSKSKNKDETIY